MVKKIREEYLEKKSLLSFIKEQEGVSYYIRHGYEYDDGDMHGTRRVLLLFHEIFKNRNNYLLTGVTHEHISTDTMSSMGEHQPHLA